MSERSLRLRARALVRSARQLADDVDALVFAAPVTHVYNPLVYARSIHESYLECWAARGARTLLLGMNPGPFGMAQTGVPFGEIAAVREWLGLRGAVGRPSHEHPRRPVTGLDCQRSEVSGRRLWGWARERFGTPERFFERFVVMNYCPLVFMEESGRNRTPDKLPKGEREPLFERCDEALRRHVEILGVREVLGVGRFAEARSRDALAGLGVEIGVVPHPSPANPRANAGWAPLIDAILQQRTRREGSGS